MATKKANPRKKKPVKKSKKKGTKKRIKKASRSSESGRFVSKRFADTHKSTTQTERIS